MTDRETLEKVAAGYTELRVLEHQKALLVADMIHACICLVQKGDKKHLCQAVENLNSLIPLLTGTLKGLTDGTHTA